MNMHTTLPALTVSEIEGEPRVLDTDLGKALGMAQPANIRTTIAKHWQTLEAFGSIHVTHEMIAIGKGAKRRVSSFWLNEEQALYVTMHCRTERAEAVKVQLVKVFTAWRRGQLVPAESQVIDFSNPLQMARLIHQQAAAFIQLDAAHKASEEAVRTRLACLFSITPHSPLFVAEHTSRYNPQIVIFQCLATWRNR